MTSNQLFELGRTANCPKDQILNFARAHIFLQPKQLVASAAARQCDQPDGPTAIAFGGARGGGKSHWLLLSLRTLASKTPSLRKHPGLCTSFRLGAPTAKL